MGHDGDMTNTTTRARRDNVTALPGVEASFLDGRRTYTTDPNRTDAIQVAMFDAANVDEPALFDGLFT